MTQLTSIPGIGDASLELLEAAGFQTAEALANVSLSELTREIERANSVLKITKRPPAPKTIGKWIRAARQLVEDNEESASAPAIMPVNFEQSPEAVTMLANAPLAIPLPARILLDHQLGVADIPAAILLNRYSGDRETKDDQRLPMSRPLKPAAPAGNSARLADTPNSRPEMDITRIRSTGTLGEAIPKVTGTPNAPADSRVALIRAPRSSTNKGRDPQSRRYIRGVLHTHPVFIYVGAITTLVCMIMMPLAVISATLLLASGEDPAHFSWVPKILLALPMALPVFGFAYLIWGLGGSCRICGQKLFLHRSHFKNSKAHHLRGLGYVLPLCLHLLLFFWFRCTHCGTPIRLKE